MWHSGSQQVIFRQVKLKFGSPQINFAVCRSLDAGGVGNCGYTKETEEKAIAEGHADLISFGRPLHQRPGPRGALQERLAAGGTSAGVPLVVPPRSERVHGLPGLRTFAHPKLRSVVIQPTKPHSMQKRRQAMSSIPILLTRNLQDRFGENDPARRL